VSDSDSLGLHQDDMVAHEVAENTAERWELPERFKCLIWIGREQRPHDRLVAFRMVLGTQIGNGIAGDQRFPHEEVEEAIDDAGAMQQRRRGPLHGTFAQPRFKHFSAKLSR
jgi:hypothetical protein